MAKKTAEKSTSSALKKRALWTLLFVAIAALTVWAVTAQSKSFSFKSFLAFLGELDPLWLCAALLAMLFYIFFEGAAIKVILHAVGYPRSTAKNLSYSAADIYFSAITPSATGGQPASAFFMVKDGIPLATTTVVLLFNLILYAFAIVTLGVFCFILKPSVFYFFSVPGRVLIIVGFAAQLLLAALFFLLLRYPAILQRAGEGIINLLGRMRILRKTEQKKEKLAKSIGSYGSCVTLIGKRWGAILGAFALNVLQRACFIAATVFTCCAISGGVAHFAELWAGESMVILASNYVPIPGAMGITDTLLLDVLGGLFDEVTATNLELFCRTVSFYLCILLCGGATLFRSIALTVRGRKSAPAVQDDQGENDAPDNSGIDKNETI